VCDAQKGGPEERSWHLGHTARVGWLRLESKRGGSAIFLQHRCALLGTRNQGGCAEHWEGEAETTVNADACASESFRSLWRAVEH